MNSVFLFLVSLLATTLGAISGIGGGVLIKPVLDALSGLPTATISFLSGCTVLAMAVVSLLRSRKGSLASGRRGTYLALGAALGGMLGKQLFDLLRTSYGNERAVGIVQSTMMVLLTLGVFFYVLRKERIRTRDVKNPCACAAIGLTLGLLSAFLGIGGGPINLVVLYYFFSMDTKTAALQSIYIILFSQLASLLRTLLTGSVPDFQPSTLLLMLLGGIGGGFLGRALASRMRSRQIDLLFRIILLCITLISAYNLVLYIVT